MMSLLLPATVSYCVLCDFLSSVPGAPMNLEVNRTTAFCNTVILKWSEPSQDEQNGTYDDWPS